MGDKTKGLDGKYDVRRNDGKDKHGEKHHGCDYFVLDLTHDPHSAPALLAYADSCERDGYEKLAEDLRAKVPGIPSPESARPDPKFDLGDFVLSRGKPVAICDRVWVKEVGCWRYGLTLLQDNEGDLSRAGARGGSSFWTSEPHLRPIEEGTAKDRLVAAAWKTAWAREELKRQLDAQNILLDAIKRVDHELHGPYDPRQAGLKTLRRLHGEDCAFYVSARDKTERQRCTCGGKGALGGRTN